MLGEESFFHRAIAVSDLAQHPSYRLVDEVFIVGDEVLRNSDCSGEIVALDEVVGRDDRDTTLPQAV